MRVQPLIETALGRVAAGAIAEKYLKTAFGVEIVAFVSSVGKIHLPASVAPPSLTPLNTDEDDDTAQDALSPEFINLLATITREEVDKHPTRCPHEETAGRMTKVSVISTLPAFETDLKRGSASSGPKRHKTPSAGPSLVLSGMYLLVSESPYLTNSKLP